MWRRIVERALVLAVAVVVFGTGVVSAQGKGGGKGHGGGQKQDRGNREHSGDRGHGGQKHGGGREWRGGRPDFVGQPRMKGDSGREHRPEQRQIDWAVRRHQQQTDWNARRQRQIADWNAQRQQHEISQRRQSRIDEWNSRRQQRYSEMNARRQQQISDWNSRRQQERSDRESRRQHLWSDLGSRRQQGFRERRERFDDDDDRHKKYRDFDRRWDRDRDEGSHGRRNGWNGNWPRGNAYGLRGIWPGEFRGWRDPAKQARRSAGSFRGTYPPYWPENAWPLRSQRDHDPYTYVTPVYNPAYYDSYGRDREDFVRDIISSFFNEPSYAYEWYPRRTVASYQPYYDYYPDTVSYAYAPAYYDTYYAPASYDQYNPAAYDDGYRNVWLSLAGELLRGLLGQGYIQGLDDGEYARQQGWGDDYYDDPYDFRAVEFAAFPTVLDEQRRCLSEGYALGYRDALAGRDPYDADMLGEVDLVSVLLGNALYTGI